MLYAICCDPFHLYFGLLKKLSNASIKTLGIDVPFSVAYRSILLTIRQGSSTVKICIGSAHSFAVVFFVIRVPSRNFRMLRLSG